MVTATINGTQVEAIVDTGAEATLLSEGFYASIRTGNSSHEEKHSVVRLHNAEDGSAMRAR